MNFLCNVLYTSMFFLKNIKFVEIKLLNYRNILKYKAKYMDGNI